MMLVLGERECINTLSYLILVIMAYYGPNAEIMGNIKGQFWQFQQPIEDMEAYASNVLILFGVEILTLVINGALLWHFCKINILKTLKKLQHGLWLQFAMVETFHLMEVFEIMIYICISICVSKSDYSDSTGFHAINAWRRL